MVEDENIKKIDKSNDNEISEKTNIVDDNKKEKINENKDIENKKIEGEENKDIEKQNKDSVPKNEGEKICETFEVSDEKGKHEITTCNSVPKKHANKKENNTYNLILRNILIVLGFIIIAFISWMIFLNSIGTVKYNGLNFEVVSQGNLIFYKHIIPLYNGDVHYANYNVFLRKNPYKTGDISFEGKLNIRNFVAINSTNFQCDGDGIISMANMVKPFEIAGITVVNDPNATCDEESKYMLLHIFPGEENKIVQTGETCYDMTVKDCDILDVTERMMLEMFVLIKEANKKITEKDSDPESRL